MEVRVETILLVCFYSPGLVLALQLMMDSSYYCSMADSWCFGFQVNVALILAIVVFGSWNIIC